MMLKRLLRNLSGGGRPAAGHTGPAQDALRHFELAQECIARRRFGEAERHYRDAIRRDPESPALRYNLGLLLHEVGDLAGAEGCYRDALTLCPDDQAVQSSLLCIGDFSTTLTRDEIFERHRLWARTFADPLTPVAPPHQSTPDPASRIRVGYVSADLRNHVIGRFMEPVLACHDSERFEVFCYSNTLQEDDFSRHLQGLAKTWRSIAELDDAAVADLIRADRIDLLVDLSGHSAGNRLLVFARKPAPVQLTWMGYLNTTGMMAMDYRISDRDADPAGADRWYSEILLRLPRPQWCCMNPKGTLERRALRERRQDAPITFACMTRFMKVSDEAVALWIRLLQLIPDTRLRIVDVPDHPRGDAVRRRFREAGLEERTEFLPTLYGDEYWNRFDDIDIALDPFPYTGATTTCDCLWMGVPVITLVGPCGAARSATSLLRSVGLGRLCAASIDEYIAAAMALARDRDGRTELRTSLPVRMARSSTCDPAAFTRDLEHLFQLAWDGWCEPPPARQKQAISPDGEYPRK